MTFASFDGLQNTVKMNEYMLSLEQDVMSVQRASMLLQRNSNENWPYGLGIDFTNVTVDGTYRVFKWCSPFQTYGDIKTKSALPSYDPSHDVGSTLSDGTRNGYLPIPESQEVFASNTCEITLTESELRGVPGYSAPSLPPKSTTTITQVTGVAPVYIIFESVSGRAFLYDKDGAVLNYDKKGVALEPKSFEISFKPTGVGKERKIRIASLSGKITIISGINEK